MSSLERKVDEFIWRDLETLKARGYDKPAFSQCVSFKLLNRVMSSEEELTSNFTLAADDANRKNESVFIKLVQNYI